MNDMDISFIVLFIAFVLAIVANFINVNNIKELEEENDILFKKLKEFATKGETAKIAELRHEVKMLQNRCGALTDGSMCMFCPYECDNRVAEQIANLGNKEDEDNEEV